MKFKLYLVSLVLLTWQTTLAQQHFVDPEVVNATTGYSGTGANIDVVYHRCNWTVQSPNVGKSLSGVVTTYFKTTAANVSSISFDLNSASFGATTTVKYHGTTCVKTLASNILTITLPSTIVAVNTLDSVVITYSGTPPAVSGAAQGYQIGGATPNKFMSTLSESFEDRDWWPCKADMQDKIDSMDIIVTVPWVAGSDTFWVASNGKLIDSTITGANRTFTYKTRYPIASYLVCLAVAKYTKYYRTVNVNGTMLPVVYYLLANSTGQAAKVTNMDKVTALLPGLGNLFGDYPFKLEKHGFYDGCLGAGGMEHQTFSSIATAQFNIKTLTHELMHQWFGDNVSFATWNDLWLAEGFARYSEALAPELASGLGYTAFSERSSTKTNALNLTSESAWMPNSNASSSDGMWNTNYGSTVYERGAMIVSMLRTMCGDAKFSQAVKNYQTALKGKAATTDSLKNHFNAVLGVDISEFFKDYVGGSGKGTTAVGGVGNPIHSVNWNSGAISKKLYLQIGTQTRTAGSNVAYFNGPVVVHATNAASSWTKDTTIVFYDWGGGNISYAGNGVSAPVSNTLEYNLSFTATNVFIDDSARTMSTGSANKLISLAAKILDFSVHKTSTGNDVSLSLVNTEPVLKVEVMKGSNGTDFTYAGLMNLSNTTSQAINFQFADAFPYADDTYYKAKIYYNNEVQYSNIVRMQNAQVNSITVSPNPAHAVVKIAFKNKNAELVKIKIIDAAGKTVFETSTKKEFINYDVATSASGIYMINVIRNEAVTDVSRMIVQ